MSLRQQQQHKFAFGAEGEQRALAFLQKIQIIYLAKNVRVRNHEVDILGYDEMARELVFIEVKTRHTAAYGHPSKAVDYFKLRSMRYVASAVCDNLKYTGDYRFDILSVLPGKIEHYTNITW